MQIREYTSSHPPLVKETDMELARRVLDGDQQAFEGFVHRYSTSLFNFICRFLGDYDQSSDVLQQVFLRFYISLPKLGVSSPLKPWLFQVARNCCVDELRRRRRYAMNFSQMEGENGDGELSFLADIPDTSPLPEEIVEHRDLQRMLQVHIETLPPRFRSVVLLRYSAQLSFAEIGKVLSMPEATAKTYFHRAKAQLRLMLHKQSVMFA